MASRTKRGVWNLGFGASLDVGGWRLEFAVLWVKLVAEDLDFARQVGPTLSLPPLVGCCIEPPQEMSAIAQSQPLLSVDEYLEGERFSDIRHEYVGGYVYAMAGASDDHNRIAGNIFSALHSRLSGKRCEPFINDMKLKIPGGQAFYYPNVL